MLFRENITLYVKVEKSYFKRERWDYKWESTAAYSNKNSKGKLSGTTFMKVSEKFKIATGNNGQ
jgi:hypothetical protein